MSVRSLLVLATTLSTFACAGEDPVLLGSGTYAITADSNGEPLKDWADVTVTIDTEALTLTIAGDSVDVATDLTELPEDEWELNCPTNFSAVSLETFGTADAITLGDTTLDEPLLANGCQGDEGTTATTAWLSSKAYQTETGASEEGMYYLEQQ